MIFPCVLESYAHHPELLIGFLFLETQDRYFKLSINKAKLIMLPILEGRRTRKPHIIYEALKDEDEEQENIPLIIAELNENLTKDASPDQKYSTVEWIAEKAGINKNILYEWVESGVEFTTAFERLKDVQENDRFKTGTEEDTFVNAMMIALAVMETRDRHYKSENS